MPTPRKSRAKKHVLDSFSEDVAEEDIPIFTDSHERIPEVDTSIDNPFYGHHSPPAPVPAKRRSQRQVSIPGEGKVSIEEAVRREDGVLTTFRGKKQFRKFSVDETNDNLTEALDDSDGGFEVAVEPKLRRPLTRSTVKPRLLFPTQPITNEDEEATTDIEDHVLADAQDSDLDPHTPMEMVDDAPETPVAPRFAPVSPPTTSRTTRHANKPAEPGRVKTGRGGKRSPFDSWARVKNGTGSHSQKRVGEALAGDPVKRART